MSEFQSVSESELQSIEGGLHPLLLVVGMVIVFGLAAHYLD